ncbi:MAG: hypothetical protein IJU23_13250 [Proteobacteria bacterium]|nr:hypothetical protein [Pseudomonadota bacterium]
MTALADDAYHLSANLPQSSLQVHAELRGIVPSEKICLPAFGQRYGESLRNVRVTSQTNIDSTPDEYGCFHGISANEIILDYELELKPLDAEHFWIASELSAVNQNGMLTIPGESLFIERGADNTETTSVKTTVEISNAGWIVSTLPKTASSSDIIIQNIPGEQLHTFGKEPPKSQSFKALDRFELTRSYWTFGQFKHREVTSGNTRWQFAIAPDWHYNDTALAREIEAILGYYQRLLPQKTPSHVAIYIFNAPFDADYHHGFARPNGIILQLGIKATSESDTRRILMAHELFHLYNGEGLRFDIAKQEETAWFREGMTQYMALHALLAIGLMTPAQFYHWIAASLQKQSNSHYDHYHHGFFASLAIEQQWTLYQTGYTLEKFWQFAASSPYWNLLQTNSSLQNMLTQYSAFDFEQFFKNYIEQTNKLPTQNLLRLNGLCIYSNQSVGYSTGAEYGFNPKTSRLYISQIAAHSPAAQGGLLKGDIIIPEKDINWHDQTDKKLTVVRKDKKIMLRIPVATEVRKDMVIDKCR